MNKEEQVEYDQIKAKAEALHKAAERLEDRALMVRVCFEAESGCDYLTTARLNLTKACGELAECIEALASHGEA